MEYLFESGYTPRGNTPFITGGYVTGDLQTGIRNYDMSNSPLNYSDIGYHRTPRGSTRAACSAADQARSRGPGDDLCAVGPDRRFQVVVRQRAGRVRQVEPLDAEHVDFPGVFASA